MEGILSLLLIWNLSTDKDIRAAQDFFPLQPGYKWHYEWNKSEICLEVESAPREINGKVYWVISDKTPQVALDSSTIVFERQTFQLYKMGRHGMPIATMYYRRDSNGNLYWYDDETGTENLFIPAKVKEGDTWTMADKRMETTVVSTNGIFESKSEAFKKCLVLSTKLLDRSHSRSSVPQVHMDYYCPGIGLVGSKTGDKVTFKLLKWNTGTP